MDNPQVFSIIALKGGVGKTTVVSNLGAALADQFGKKVLIVDANYSTPHLGLHVGLINTDKTLHSVLEDTHPIEDVIYEHPIGFHVIPGKLSPYAVNYGSLKSKLDPLREHYDIILIDSSPSLNEEMLSVMEASDEIIVVSSPDYPTLSSTLHAVMIAKERGSSIRGLVLNKVRGKGFELTNKDIVSASDVDILGKIPDDVKVLSSLSRMVPHVTDAPNTDASHNFKKLAGSLVGEKYNKGILGIGRTKKKKSTKKQSKPSVSSKPSSSSKKKK